MKEKYLVECQSCNCGEFFEKLWDVIEHLKKPRYCCSNNKEFSIYQLKDITKTLSYVYNDTPILSKEDPD